MKNRNKINYSKILAEEFEKLEQRDNLDDDELAFLSKDNNIADHTWNPLCCEDECIEMGVKLAMNCPPNEMIWSGRMDNELRWYIYAASEKKAVQKWRQALKTALAKAKKTS